MSVLKNTITANATLNKVTNNRSTALQWKKYNPSDSDAEVNRVHCRHCGNICIKAGKERSGKQRYKCTVCKKRQVASFTYNAYNQNINDNIKALIKEGVGIRAMARLLDISVTTLLSRIKKMAAETKEPTLTKGKTYEVDELRTFIKKKGKLIWVVSAYCRETHQIVRINVGNRTNTTQ